ncbi:MAG: class I SAM-dependent methyltransferase [Bacteroidales bacterium]
MKKDRISNMTDKGKIWQQDYLVYRYLWPNISWALEEARNKVVAIKPMVLDIGCGKKPYKGFFAGCQYAGVDISPKGALPDIIGDSMALPIKDSSTDIVFSSQVIEHVPDPVSMSRECFRILKPGGLLILTAPFYWPLHEEPNDFFRFTKYGLGNLMQLSGFATYEIRPDGGDWGQIFLSINLKISKYLFPFRIMLNLIGFALDYYFYSDKSPANYTLIAVK